MLQRHTSSCAKKTRKKSQFITILIIVSLFTLFFMGCPSPDGSNPAPTDEPEATPEETSVPEPTAEPTPGPTAPPPVAPDVTGPTLTGEVRPTWTWNTVPDATLYRYSFTDGSDWVEQTELSYTSESDLSNGFYTLYVQAGNPAGWSASGSWTIEVDTTLPPPPTITGLTSGSFNTTQSFTITDILANATAYYSLNNGTDWIEYTAQVDISAEGVYQVVAGQIDEYTKVSPATFPSINVTIDISAPDPPAGLDLDNTDDSGDSDTDNITNHTTQLTITGTADADTAVSIYSDVDGLTGSTTADGSGSWSGDISLTPGTHTITATQTDLVGHTSPSSAGLTITIDTTPPGIPSPPDLAAADDSGALDTDNITLNITGLTFTGTAEANISIALISDLDGTLATGTADGSGNYSFDPVTIPTSVNHTHSITARATDTAGNTATSTGLSLTIDTTDPVIRSALSTADRIVAIDTTVASNFTDEIGTTSAWDSGTKELTLTDLAGNTTLMTQMIYEGAEVNGLRTAVQTDATDGEIIYLCTGTYSLTNKRLQINYSLILRGDGSDTTFIVQPINNQRCVEIMITDKTVNIEYLGLDTVNRECIFSASGIIVDLYVRDLQKGPTATGKEFVDIGDNGSTAHYWNGNSYSAATDGVNGWLIVPTVNISFTADADTTYWQ